MEKTRNAGECLMGVALVIAALAVGYGACGALAQKAMVLAGLN